MDKKELEQRLAQAKIDREGIEKNIEELEKQN